VAQTRIVFLIGNYGTGGKERQLTEIIWRLAKEKYEVHLFMKNDNSYYFDTIKGHVTSYYSLEKEKFSILDILALRLFNKSIQPDVVFSFSTTLSHYALLLKLLGGFHFRLINGSIRDAPVEFNMKMKFERFMYNFYEQVVANSRAGLRAYNQHGKNGRYVLYNGFNDDRIPRRSKDELREELGLDDKFTVIMVASMGNSKDQTTFIRAANQIIKEDNDIQFYLIGDGPKKNEYEKLVESLNNKKNVFFTGEVNSPELYFCAADLSVLCSAYWHGEGIPNVVLESMATGTPAIATNNGGTKEILINNFNGYLIKNGDYNRIAKYILDLKKDNTLLKKLGKNSRLYAENYFFIDKIKTDFINLLSES